MRRLPVLACFFAACLFAPLTPPRLSAAEPLAVPPEKSPVHSPYALKQYDKIFYSFNGRFWTGLRPEEKGLYVEGVKNGMALFLTLASRDGPDQKLFAAFERGLFPALDSLQIARRIDGFYADKANLRVPIVNMYLLAGAELSGKTPKAEIEATLAELRRTYSQTYSK